MLDTRIVTLDVEEPDHLTPQYDLSKLAAKLSKSAKSSVATTTAGGDDENDQARSTLGRVTRASSSMGELLPTANAGRLSSVMSRPTLQMVMGEPKYRLGSFLVYDHPKKLGEFAWKNREKVEVKRNWGSLFSEDGETLFSGPENKITADAIVEKSPLPSNPLASDKPRQRKKGDMHVGFSRNAPSIRPQGIRQINIAPKDFKGDLLARDISLQSAVPQSPPHTTVPPPSPVDGDDPSAIEFQSTLLSLAARLTQPRKTLPLNIGSLGVARRMSSEYSAEYPYTPNNSPMNQQWGNSVQPVEILNQQHWSNNEYSPYDYAWNAEQYHDGGNWSSWGWDNAAYNNAQYVSWSPTENRKISISASIDADNTHPTISPTWTVILLDENVFRDAHVKDDLQKKLASIRVKAYKSTLKCWRSLENKTHLVKSLFVVSVADAPEFADLLVLKFPDAKLIVFGDAPVKLPMPYCFSRIEDLIQTVGNVTGCVTRRNSIVQGIDYSIIWVDEMSFKSQGQARKRDLELLSGCIGVKTYKCGEKSTRALGKRQKLEAMVFLVSQAEANEVLKYLSSRDECLPVVVECLENSRFEPTTPYNPSYIMVTSSWEETHARLSEFGVNLLVADRVSLKAV